MDRERLNLVITGHVDHGKSTLIGRLLFDSGSLNSGLVKEIKSNLKGTGIKMEFAHIMDYFEEERREERTIDTSQFFFNIKNRRYVIIDTPGHKEFIKNMLTGSSQAESAVLIISAKEGVQEQTKRHAYLLKMLGIKDIILAINKMDLVNYKIEIFEEIKTKAKDIIDLLGIRQDNIIPISAQGGENISTESKYMPWYMGLCLFKVLDNIKQRWQSTRVLRFPVQDIYSLAEKKVIVGRLSSGRIKVRDTVIIFPQGVKTKVRSIELFGQKSGDAYSGQSIGITLDDLNNIHIERGNVICDDKSTPQIKNKIKANIFWIALEKLSVGDCLQIKCATFEEKCKIEEIIERIDSSTLEIIERNSNILENTQAGKVTIHIDKPMVIEDFNFIPEMGRFILLKDNQVCAGGIITEQ